MRRVGQYRLLNVRKALYKRPVITIKLFGDSDYAVEMTITDIDCGPVSNQNPNCGIVYYAYAIAYQIMSGLLQVLHWLVNYDP